MARFSFRFQRVLDYRKMQVEWAARAVGVAGAALANVDEEIYAVGAATLKTVGQTPKDVNGRLAIQRLLETLDARARAAEIQRAEALTELEQAQEDWREAKAELGAMEALESIEKTAWLYAEARREQAELDEWAVTRRILGPEPELYQEAA